jgi:hypothetical protein
MLPVQALPSSIEDRPALLYIVECRKVKSGSSGALGLASNAGKLYELAGGTWKQPPSAIETTPANDTHQ